MNKQSRKNMQTGTMAAYYESTGKKARSYKQAAEHFGIKPLAKKKKN